MHELKMENLFTAKCGKHYVNILFLLDWFKHIKIYRKHIRYYLEKGYKEKLTKSKKKVKKELIPTLTYVMESSFSSYSQAIKYKFIDFDVKIKNSNDLTYYLNKLVELDLITWDNEDTGEIKITKKGRMFVLIRFSHFCLDELYSEDETLLPKIPELLFLNKKEDFVGNYKMKKIKNI